MTFAEQMTEAQARGLTLDQITEYIATQRPDLADDLAAYLRAQQPTAGPAAVSTGPPARKSRFSQETQEAIRGLAQSGMNRGEFATWWHRNHPRWNIKAALADYDAMRGQWLSVSPDDLRDYREYRGPTDYAQEAGRRGIPLARANAIMAKAGVSARKIAQVARAWKEGDATYGRWQEAEAERARAQPKAGEVPVELGVARINVPEKSLVGRAATSPVGQALGWAYEQVQAGGQGRQPMTPEPQSVAGKVGAGLLQTAGGMVGFMGQPGMAEPWVGMERIAEQEIAPRVVARGGTVVEKLLAAAGRHPTLGRIASRGGKVAAPSSVFAPAEVTAERLASEGKLPSAGELAGAAARGGVAGFGLGVGLGATGEVIALPGNLRRAATAERAAQGLPTRQMPPARPEVAPEAKPAPERPTEAPQPPQEAAKPGEAPPAPEARPTEPARAETPGTEVTPGATRGPVEQAPPERAIPYVVDEYGVHYRKPGQTEGYEVETVTVGKWNAYAKQQIAEGKVPQRYETIADFPQASRPGEAPPSPEAPPAAPGEVVGPEKAPAPVAAPERPAEVKVEAKPRAPKPLDALEREVLDAETAVDRAGIEVERAIGESTQDGPAAEARAVAAIDRHEAALERLEAARREIEAAPYEDGAQLATAEGGLGAVLEQLARSGGDLEVRPVRVSVSGLRKASGRPTEAWSGDDAFRWAAMEVGYAEEQVPMLRDQLEELLTREGGRPSGRAYETRGGQRFDRDEIGIAIMPSVLKEAMRRLGMTAEHTAARARPRAAGTRAGPEAEGAGAAAPVGPAQPAMFPGRETLGAKAYTGPPLGPLGETMTELRVQGREPGQAPLEGAASPAAAPPTRTPTPEPELPLGWRMEVGRTRTKEGHTFESEVDWPNKRIVFSTPEHMADPEIRSHEIAHVLVETLPDAARTALLDDYVAAKTPDWNERWPDGADWVVKNRFHREEIAMDYGTYLRDPTSVPADIRAIFEKHFPTGPEGSTPPAAEPVVAAEVPRGEGEAIAPTGPTETAGPEEIAQRRAPGQRPLGQQPAPTAPTVASVPATPQPRTTGRRIGRADVLRHLADQLKVALRVGRVKRGALGQVRVRDEVARVRSAADLDTAYHEAGEVLSRRAKLLPPDDLTTAEMAAMGAPVAGQNAPLAARVKEGMAEYVRHYIADPARATAEAPNYTAYFEEALAGIRAGKGTMLDAVRAARDMHERWASQNPVDAFRAELVGSRKAQQLSEPVRRVCGWWARVMTRAFGNRNVNLEKATEQLRRAFRETTGRELPATEDPYRTLARSPMKVQRQFEEIVERGWHETDPATGQRTKVAPSLAEVKGAAEKGGGSFEDWEAWQAARHGLDLMALREAEAAEAGKAGPPDTAVMPATKGQLQAVVGQLDSPEFREATRLWTDLVRQQRLFMEANGLADPGFADAMAEKYPNWVPLTRVFMESEVGGAGVGELADVASLVKRLRGSGRPIRSPIEEFQVRLRIMLDLADFFTARRQFTEAAGASRGMGWLATEVSKKTYGREINDQQLTQMFRELVKGLAGSDEALGEITPEVVQRILASPKLWSAAQGPAFKENVLPVLQKDGGVELWQFHPDLIPDLTRTDGFRLPDHWVFAVPKMVTSVVRNLNTTFYPAWVLFRNAVKDIPTALIQTPDVMPSVFVRWEKGGRGLWRPRVGDMLDGFYAAVRKTNKYREFESEGAYQGGREGIMMEPSDYASAWAEAAHQLRKASASDINVISAWNGAVSRWIAVGQALEEGTRTGAAMARERWALGRDKSPMEARLLGVEAARESTVPFERGGEVTKGINPIKAFFNVQFQGPYTAFRALTRNPVGVAWRATKVLTIPTMIYLALMHDDKDWQQLPAYRKYTGWNPPIGRDEKGEMKFGWVPFPYEWGAMFATPVIAAVDWLRTHDPDTWKDFVSIAMQSSPTGDVGDLKDAGSPAEGMERFITGPFMGLIPDVLRSPLEIAVNKDWLGRNIVPYWEQKKAPELQQSEYSSEIARKAGQMLNYSPRKIDYLLRGYGGGLTRSMVAVFDALVEASGRGTRPVPQGGLTESLALTIRSSQSPRMVERFYTELAGLERKQSLEDAGRATMSSKEGTRLDDARSIQRELAEINRDIDATMADKALTPEQRRDEAIRYLAERMRVVAEFVGDEEPDWVTKALAAEESE